jgi:hypothetical protein
VAEGQFCTPILTCLDFWAEKSKDEPSPAAVQLEPKLPELTETPSAPPPSISGFVTGMKLIDDQR